MKINDLLPIVAFASGASAGIFVGASVNHDAAMVSGFVLLASTMVGVAVAFWLSQPPRLGP